jgi:signal transduction protein with GAF and PtsI domain
VRFAHMPETTEAQGLYEENRPVSGDQPLRLIDRLGPMLQGIVDLATEATDCHSCFVYLLADGVLTMRAASPVYANAVGVVQTRLDGGLAGWVARHRTPEFIRENSMADPG